MLAKSWKKICLFILIIACLWNIVAKIVVKVSFEETIKELQKDYQRQERVNNTN